MSNTVEESKEITESIPEVEIRKITIRTPGFDARFPNTNQAKNCWQNYVDYYRCVEAKGDDFEPCKQFKSSFLSLCPTKWVSCYIDLESCMREREY